MTTPPAGISEADWLSWPAGARTFILSQQEEIEQLRAQLTALSTELASLRERIGRSSRNSSKPPSSDGPGLSRPSGVKAVAESGAVSRAIPDLDRSCCRLSALTRCWSTTLMPAAAAAPCCRGRIPSPIGTR